jgi:hypothetical protein
MLSLHALLIFLFCASAVAPLPPLRSANTPYLRPEIPGKAKGPYYRVIMAPDRTVRGITFNPNLSVSHLYDTA